MFRKNKISICYIDSSNLGNSVVKAVKQLNNENGDIFGLNVIPLHSIGDPKTREKQLKLIEEGDLVLADIRGDNPLIDDILAATRKGSATVAALLGGSFRLMSLTKMGIFDANKFFNSPRAKNMSSGFSNISGETNFDDIDNMLKKKLPKFVYKDIGAWFEVTRYWGINGTENIKQMIIMLARNYCKVRSLPKPNPPLREPSPAIRHPKMEKLYVKLQDYLRDYNYDISKPTVVIIYYDGMHYENCIVPVSALINELEPDINIIPISCDGIKNLDAIEKLALLDGKFIGDAIVHMTWFRLGGGPLGGKEENTFALLKKLNVPVFHPVTAYTMSVDRWKKSQNGISPVDYLANIVLPETDGGIEPLLLCATEEIAGSEFEAVVPINDRIVRCAGRIRRMMKLKKTDNSRKKLALVVYNYPPGEHNLANAAYLDSFESIRNILIRLDKEGYNVGEIPENISDLFLENNIVNSPKWSSRHCGALIDKDEYENLLSSCPELEKDIEGIWGAYPGAVNTYDGKIRIPYLRFGNIYVTLQPSRGCHEDPQKFYHDKSIPPHHQYAAFYRWLEKNMDAVIHIGTHGTLEFMRGKEMTISQNCDMDILIGDLPHFYIYQVGNPSEAMTAKRRSLATLIGYSPPSADGAGLYGEYLALRELFDELHEARLMNSQRVPSIEEEIRQKAEENNWTDLKGDLEAIEGRLTDLQRSLIPIGLHTFGNTMEEKERIDFLASVMRFDRGAIKSVNRVLAEQDGLDYTKMLEQKSPKLIEYDLKARELISAWIRGEEAPPELKDQKAFITGVLKNIESDFELDGLINALSGGYAGSGLAADVLKNPEVFPSGRNLYQFNPLSIPTASAVERGRTIALNTLKQYRGKNGEYPKSVGVVLWGFETAKTCGETVGQVMEYLGVRIKSETGSWFTQIEPVPREELTHPRIDVTIQICGFFRDMFPNLVALLDDAVRIAAKLDEPDNAVYDKAVSICSLLISEGIDKKSAEEMSFIRIFGPRESEYGTSLTTMIENAAWQDERELGESYERDMSYAYGRNISGAENRRLNKILLSQVEMISQVQDTYEYDVTDLDHYYEFFGGFSKAVENNRGEKPQMLATNTASEIIRTEDISDAISRGAVSRTFNPKWINAMLEHDYHGAQKIADRIQYQIGLSATTGSVEQWVWEKTAQTFLFDDEMLRKLRENNVHAANEIAMRLYEAKQRGYWKASAEEAEKLMRILMEFEEHLEGGS